MIAQKPIKIVFLGSDGTGKSTLIRYIKNELEKEKKTSEVFVFGWKDFKNPIIKVFSKIYLKNKSKKKKNQERLLRFRNRSWFFYFLYYIELLSRYKKVKKSKKDYVLIDRYFYEEIMFMSESQLKFFKKLTPVPNVCFVLKSPIEIIRMRGHYASKEAFENFYNHIEKLSKIYQIVMVDSTESLEKIYKKIKSFIP